MNRSTGEPVGHRLATRAFTGVGALLCAVLVVASSGAVPPSPGKFAPFAAGPATPPSTGAPAVPPRSNASSGSPGGVTEPAPSSAAHPRPTGPPVRSSDPTGTTAAFFVAPDGKDSWNGTTSAPDPSLSDGPFLTLTRAQLAVRNELHNTSLAPGWITVWIASGTYALTAPLQFGALDSGTSANPVAWVALPDRSCKRRIVCSCDRSA
ncbi:MAG: hypothetical protein L3K03_07645, partial [Thermoplasmata archaeon]|nr:hypothetical protein [Thermoplasmata archaeon]